MVARYTTNVPRGLMMSNVMSPNGRARKTLADQIDRLDRVLDGLAEGLNEAVAMEVQRAVGLAVRGWSIADAGQLPLPHLAHH